MLDIKGSEVMVRSGPLSVSARYRWRGNVTQAKYIESSTLTSYSNNRTSLQEAINQ